VRGIAVASTKAGAESAEPAGDDQWLLRKIPIRNETETGIRKTRHQPIPISVRVASARWMTRVGVMATSSSVSCLVIEILIRLETRTSSSLHLTLRDRMIFVRATIGLVLFLVVRPF